MHFQRYHTNLVVNLTKYGNNEFYNRSMKTWLQGNDIGIHSTNLLLLTDLLELCIMKYTLIPKYVYVDRLDDEVDTYSNTDQKSTKMRPNDVKLSAYIDFDIQNNDKNCERLSEYKIIIDTG